ncbi:MAG TPA: hypothetical protein VMX97_06115, partial [Hyphomicrobiaceae bacterium]|nr:hypothetical protein [Hyphomicrobiaceae bacterium]
MPASVTAARRSKAVAGKPAKARSAKVKPARPAKPAKLTPAPLIASATRTLKLETEGLAALAKALKGPMANSFASALDILKDTQGRV